MQYARPWTFPGWDIVGKDTQAKVKVVVGDWKKDWKGKQKGRMQGYLHLSKAKKNPKGFYTVNASSGKGLKLQMDGNATTGFQWLIKPNEDGKCLSKEVKDFYTVDKVDTPEDGFVPLGTGGTSTKVWKVIGEEGCKEVVTMYYAQPWNFPGWDKL